VESTGLFFMNTLLHITDLHVAVDNKTIVNGVNLSLKPGSVHVLMGPNGSGKSTFARTLAGAPDCTVSKGSICLGATDITRLRPDERARLGFFLVFQHPCVIPGLTVFSFLQEAYRACTGNKSDVTEFRDLLYRTMATLGIDRSFAFRGLNEGFSGGEKKRLEMLQFLILKPRVALFDEIDSGLDVDALKVVARGITRARHDNPELAIILITHSQRIVQYLKPDFVHIFGSGTIVRSGGLALIKQIEREGYDAFV